MCVQAKERECVCVCVQLLVLPAAHAGTLWPRHRASLPCPWRGEEGGCRLWGEPGARPDKLHSSPGLVKLAALNSTVLVPPSRSLSLAPHFIPIEPHRSHSHQLLSLSSFISPVFFLLYIV